LNDRVRADGAREPDDVRFEQKILNLHPEPARARLDALEKADGQVVRRGRHLDGLHTIPPRQEPIREGAAGVDVDGEPHTNPLFSERTTTTVLIDRSINQF
jgi:hypothetical protein